MSFITKAFGQFYKLINPTNIPDGNWYTGSFTTILAGGAFNAGGVYSSSYGPLSQSYVSSSGYNLMFSSSFLNYPGDPREITFLGNLDTNYAYLTTRWFSASKAFRNTSNAQVSMSALPWGSQGGDFLWNVLTPSWSYSSFGGWITWTPTWSSKSFHSHNASNGHLYGVGTSSWYPVTSSWKIFDPKYLRFQYSNTYPSQVGNQGGGTFATHSSCYRMHVNPTTGAVGVAAGQDPAINFDSFNRVNNSVFDLGGGAAITQTEVSHSLMTQSAFATLNTSASVRQVDRALRSRRLYFPITYDTSSGYWLRQFTGYAAADMFTENGGIYNVKFKLKRWMSPWTASDQTSPTGNQIYLNGANHTNSGSWDMSTAYPAAGSWMTVFIHNVLSTAPFPANRSPGADGWYPPSNNIVTVGNSYGTTPALTFFNQETGYLEEQFDVVLVQYGYPAQLCFEPSGSGGSMWGCIIDDVEVCKIGVTTDPRFIKQQSTSQLVGQSTSNTSRAGSTSMPESDS